CSFQAVGKPPFLRRGGDYPFSCSKLGTHSVLNRFFLRRDIKNEVPQDPLNFLNSLVDASIYAL
ncbi:hypothetical protein, partial [Paenibacillus dendritiformis]|uniref:hypothetical protein n=1 Tax=Paenibacillus dendritiformis TaxID=130049 RepID=UPI001C66049F